MDDSSASSGSFPKAKSTKAPNGTSKAASKTKTKSTKKPEGASCPCADEEFFPASNTVDPKAISPPSIPFAPFVEECNWSPFSDDFVLRALPGSEPAYFLTGFTLEAESSTFLLGFNWDASEAGRAFTPAFPNRLDAISISLAEASACLMDLQAVCDRIMRSVEPPPDSSTSGCPCLDGLPSLQALLRSLQLGDLRAGDCELTVSGGGDQAAMMGIDNDNFFSLETVGSTTTCMASYEGSATSLSFDKDTTEALACLFFGLSGPCDDAGKPITT